MRHNSPQAGWTRHFVPRLCARRYIHRVEMKNIPLILLLCFAQSAYSTDLKVKHDEIISQIPYKNNANNSDLLSLSNSFYKWNRVVGETVKPAIRKHLGIAEGKLGFTLDKETMRGCSNRPKEWVTSYLLNNDVVYLYQASCLDWCGETCGKQHSVLLRKSGENGFDTLWSHKRVIVDQELIEFPFIGYMSDLDNDGNIEVLLVKAKGVASEGRIYEIDKNGLTDITYYVSNHEGM